MNDPTHADEMLLPAAPGEATLRLQQAIDAAASSGRRLILGPGEHLTRGLLLRSGLDLALADGAVLRAVGDYEAYAATTVDSVAEESDRAILAAKDAVGIRISGTGTIEAGGEAFIAGELADMGTHVPARHRPRVFVLDGCRDVRIEGITIRRSPMWTIHLIGCLGVVIDGVRVDNDRRMPNTDGIVIDSSEDVAIRGVDIGTADDGICLKTTRRASGALIGPCRSIHVADSRIESRSCALKIGTETHSDVEDVEFIDCAIVGSNRALGIFSRDGGRISRIAFRRIDLESAETPDGFWGSGEAITVNIIDRRPERPAGRVDDVVFEDVRGTMEGAVNLVADGVAGIGRVALRRIALTQVQGRLGTAQRYDLRPTHYDLAPAPESAGRANAYVKDATGSVIGLVAYPGGMPALFASNIGELRLEDVSIARPEPLPAGWNAEAMVILTGEPKRW